MIIDDISNASVYERIHDALQFGFAYVRNCPNTLEDGRYPLENGLFALVMSGQTTQIKEGLFESHEKYVDLQYVIEGEEYLVFEQRKTLQLQLAYDVQQDAAFYSGNGQVLHAKRGMFYILFPQDAHKACKHLSKPSSFKKIVLKLPI